LSAAGRFAHQRVQFCRDFGLKSERLFVLSECFVICWMYFHFIFKKYPSLMAPKKVTDVEKPKRKIIMTAVKC
jgi:hypothetical protein